jgi:hypothetical protein
MGGFEARRNTIVELKDVLDPTWDGPPSGQWAEDVDLYVDTLGRLPEIMDKLDWPSGFPEAYHLLSVDIRDGTQACLSGQDVPEAFRFDDPEKMQEFVAVFIDFFLAPLRHYVKVANGEKPDHLLTQSWKEALDPALVDEPKGLQFQVGKNSHIEVDLVLTVDKLGLDHINIDDFRKVQNYIDRLIERLGPDLIPGHPWLQVIAATFESITIAKEREQVLHDAKHLGSLPTEEARRAFIATLDRQTADQIGRLKGYGSTVLGLMSLTEYLPGGRRNPNLVQRLGGLIANYVNGGRR